MAPERVVCTLAIETDGKSRTVTLEDRIVSFGRSRKNTVTLRDDAKISSQHCQIVKQVDAWTLVDCGSKNKTFLNGSAVGIAALKDGDSIRIGNTTVTFRASAPAPMTAQEADKMMAAKVPAAQAMGDKIAEALTPKPAKAEKVEKTEKTEKAEKAQPAPKQEKSDRVEKADKPRKSSGHHRPVRVERGGAMSPFVLASFFFAGILSGMTALFAVGPSGDAEKAPPAVKASVPDQPKAPVGDGAGDVEVAGGTVETPADPPKEEPVVVKDPVEPKEEPVAVKDPVEPKEEPVVVKPPVEPKEEPVALKPPVEEPKEEPVVIKPPPPPVPASENPPTEDPTEVGVKPPVGPGEKPPVDPGEKPPANPPGGGTTAEPPPIQFMGLKAIHKYVVFVMDVTGSMEDPASSTPLEYTGPPEVKIGAELKRQLDKFNRRDVKTKLDAAKYELANAIAYLHLDVEFNVIFYSFSPTAWQKKLVAASEKNKIDAIKRVKTQAAWGGTNIFDALEMSFGMIDDHMKEVAKRPAKDPGATGGGTSAMKSKYAIFLVTDGRHNTGRFPDPEEFLQEIKKINKNGQAALHTIGVGQPGVGVDPPDPAFLMRLAEENGGQCKMVK